MRRKTEAEQKRQRFTKSTRRRIHERPLFHWIGSHIEDIADHASLHGRLGVGFPKRFLLEQGGRPVNYVAGFRCFSSPRAFRQYVLDEILHESQDQREEIAEAMPD